MQVQTHFVILSYPFRHAISGARRYSRLHKLNQCWRPWWVRHDQAALKRALDDTYFFLPYVRHMLFPETALVTEGDAAEQVSEVDRMARLPLEVLARKLESDAMLRLTYAAELVDALHPLRLEFELKDPNQKIKEQFSAPAQICWIDAALFPQNAGFLLAKVQWAASDVSMEQLGDFMYYARQVHQQTIDWTLPTWRRERTEAPLLFRSRDLVDFLLQGLTEAEEVVDPKPESFLDRVHKGHTVKRYSSTGPGQIYGDSFRLYSYACLADPHVPEASESAPRELATPAGGVPAPFGSPLDQTLYELATCTQTADPFFMPHSRKVKEMMSKGHIALWQNWEGLVVHDGTVFVGTRPSNFTLHALPHNVESDYFHLYLLTSYQKLRLSMLSGELMRHGANLHRDLKEARALSEGFAMFRNHYWFPEVTFKPQGIELYRRYHEGLGIRALYESVSESVHDLAEYYEHKAERLTGRLLLLLTVITFLVLPAEILAHVFGHRLSNPYEGLAAARLWQLAWWYVPVSLLLLFVGFVILSFGTLLNWWRRRK